MEIQDDCIQMVRGLPFDTVWKKKDIEDAMDFQPQDGDLVIASYPKTGTTWLTYIALQITSRGTSFPSFDDVSWKVVPFLEMTGIAPLQAQPRPTMFKLHLPYDYLRKNERSKILYIYRHPEDVVVSYHQFVLAFDEAKQGVVDYQLPPVEFDHFFDNFLKGYIGYGSFFEHVKGFYEHRHDPNLLILSYERLHSHTRQEILRIAAFLGEEHYKTLVEDEDLLDRIMRNTSFGNMKSQLHFTHPEHREEKATVRFFRQGEAGAGKNVLTEPQRARIREAVQKTMKGTSIAEEWLK